MRRVPHGGTTRPPMARPGAGYGRRQQLAPPPPLRVFAVTARRRVRDFSWLLAVSLED